jgi:ribonuclease P protein component
MVPRNQRLNRTAFSEVFTRGRRRHSPYLSLVYMASPSFRCAVVVSKKVAKKAHERNRLRRRLYALLRTLHEERALVGSFIILTKSPIAKLARRQFSVVLREEIALLRNNQ